MNLKSFTPSNLVHKVIRLWDKFNGLDFLTIIEPEEVGLDPNYAIHSSPSGNRYLKNVLIDFNISLEDSILDIGCGLGSAMRTMLKFPFAVVDGIELSEHIATIADRNFKILNSTRTKIFVCDASQFVNYDAYNIIYFYHPFHDNVMSFVIDALIQSVQKSDRELVIIYNNAECHNTVIAEGVFTKKGVYPDKLGHMISIYSNRDGKHSRLVANKSMQKVVF